MNIAIFAKKTTFHKGYGGLETQNKVLAEGLVRKGHDVTVFSPVWEYEKEFEDVNSVHYIFVDCVYRMGPIFGFFGTKQKNNWINRSVEYFQKEHKKRKFDIILAQSSTGLGVIKRKKELGIKIISIAHGSIVGEYLTFTKSMDLPKDFFLLVKNTGFMLKNFFRRQRDFVHGSDRIVAVSNYVKKALIEETFCEEEKIKVVHNGIDPSIFAKNADNESRGNKILYVGQIQKSKGMEDIVDMYRNGVVKDYYVDVVGSGEFIEELKMLKENNPELSKLTIVGKIPYEQVVRDYFMNPKYGVFIFPTKRFEGLPMVLIEAMFSGIPVVAYDKGGVSDAIIDGENGYLVKEEDLETFSQKVLEILNDSALRNKFSENATMQAHNKFSSEKMLSSYEKIMEEVLK